MSDLAWIDGALTAARPKAIAALLRYFGDLDVAEEAFQEACLRALGNWRDKGPPSDPAAWLIHAGRNTGIDAMRRLRRQVTLPREDVLSNREDAESVAAERLDRQCYGDDILRLLFVCCHPALPATQQIALALRIVCGLSVAQIARAFLVSEDAIEQRITRAKRRVAMAGLPLGIPGAAERDRRLTAVAAMIYLVFNEGYSTARATEGAAEGGAATARMLLCTEAIRLARLVLRLFPSDPEMMGLLALVLLQHARAAARFDASGAVVLLEQQDRTRWNRPLIMEGLALLDKAMRHAHPGPYQVQAAIAALHARASRPEDTDWAGIDLLYATLEQMQPSPVVTLNRAVAVSKVRGPEAALALVEPLAERLTGYFYFHGVRGALLIQLGRTPEARVALTHAIAVARSPADAAHIRMQLDHLAHDARAAGEICPSRQS